jgi:diadenosine tetraphosphatase ApaH/serine/threonine PP2A family protein phosphatase
VRQSSAAATNQAATARTIVAPLSKRVAVISDVHGNRHALDAVLHAIAAEQPDELWCLGDLVGYGPRPNECCRLVAAQADLCLAGNHDLVVLGTLSIHDFAGDAAAAARWTQTVLADDARNFLAGLEPSSHRDGVDLFHGSARDPVWEYVLDEEAAWWTLQATTQPLVLVGHSHVPLAIELDGDELAGGLARGGAIVELPGARRLLNPGSVGQPRDGDPRAAYLLLEPGRAASFHRVEYAIERTQAEMREVGLPEPLAARLAEGL